MKQFWEKNKVFITGLIAAVTAVITTYADQPEINWKIIGYAVLMAVLSFVANQWRGQYVTITGVIGTLAAAVHASLSTGNFTWTQFMLYMVVAVGTAVAPPPKSRGYEKSETIVAAKQQGEVIKPTHLDPKPSPGDENQKPTSS